MIFQQRRVGGGGPNPYRHTDTHTDTQTDRHFFWKSSWCHVKWSWSHLSTMKTQKIHQNLYGIPLPGAIIRIDILSYLNRIANLPSCRSCIFFSFCGSKIASWLICKICIFWLRFLKSIWQFKQFIKFYIFLKLLF